MTADEVSRLSFVVDNARGLLGRITVLRESLAWLDAGESIYVAFDRGASRPGTISAHRVPAELTPQLEKQIRDLLRADVLARLATAEAQLGNLKV